MEQQKRLSILYYYHPWQCCRFSRSMWYLSPQSLKDIFRLSSISEDTSAFGIPNQLFFSNYCKKYDNNAAKSIELYEYKWHQVAFLAER